MEPTISFRIISSFQNLSLNAFVSRELSRVEMTDKSRRCRSGWPTIPVHPCLIKVGQMSSSPHGRLNRQSSVVDNCIEAFAEDNLVLWSK